MLVQLPSNDGCSRLAIELERSESYATDLGFQCSLIIRGVHWDGGKTHAVDLSVAGLWLRLADLQDLLAALETWLRRPLRELIPELLDAEFELARLPHQSVRIRFGDRPDVVRTQHVVVTVAIEVGSLRGTYHFVSDQSCLAAFSAELAAAIDDVG